VLLPSLPRATCESGCGPNMRAMRVACTRTDRPVIMSVQLLHWAAISVLGMEYGRWPTVIMHTGGECREWGRGNKRRRERCGEWRLEEGEGGYGNGE